MEYIKKALMRSSFFFTLSIAVVLFCGLVIGYITSPPPSLPFFMRPLIQNQNSSLLPGALYQVILRQLDFVSGRGELFGVYFHGERTKKKVALTFDADMTRGMQQMLARGTVKSFYDDKLINELIRTHTPATLFLTGLWVEQYPDKTHEIASQPLFEIGSHSYTHRAYASPCYSLENLPDDRKIEDIGSSQLLIEKYTGKKTTLFRFPGGCFGPGDLALLKLAGAKAIAWDVVADDGFNSNERDIFNRVVSRAKNGSIIVMHMNGFPNEPVDYMVVPKIIDALKAKGFEFVKTSELLGL